MAYLNYEQRIHIRYGFTSGMWRIQLLSQCLWCNHATPRGTGWNTSRVSITLTSWWPRWRLKSPAWRLFTQPFIQMQINEDIKAPRQWPLCGEFTGTGEFHAQRASYAENVSIWWRHHVHKELMTLLQKNKAQLNTMRPRSTGRPFSDIYKRILLNENT